MWEATEEFSKKKNEKQKREYEEIKKGGRGDNSESFNEVNNKENGNYIDKGKFGDEIIDKFKTLGVSDSDLDSSLWSPYNLWAEKLVSLREVSEIETFKNQMFNAIEKAKIKKQQNREKNIPSDNGNWPVPFPKSHTPPNPPNFQENSSQNNDLSWNKIKSSLLVSVLLIFVFFATCYVIKIAKNKKVKGKLKKGVVNINRAKIAENKAVGIELEITKNSLEIDESIKANHNRWQEMTMRVFFGDCLKSSLELEMTDLLVNIQ